MNDETERLQTLTTSITQGVADARTFAHRGDIYRCRGQFEEALQDFHQALRLHPGYAWALAHRGETYAAMHDYQAALVDFTQALACQPDYVWALAHRGVVYQRLHRYSESLMDLNNVLALKPDYVWALIHRAHLYALMRRYEEALVDADQVVALDETAVPHWRGERGLLLNYMGRYVETMACCEPGLRQDPADYVTWYSHIVAQVYAHGLEAARMDIEAARRLMQEVVQHTPTDWEALYRLGGLAALEGADAPALDYLTTALRLHNEPRDLAHHDPVWARFRGDPAFEALISGQ